MELIYQDNIIMKREINLGSRIMLTNSKFHNTNLESARLGEVCHVSLGSAHFHDTNLGWHKNEGAITFERCD